MMEALGATSGSNNFGLSQQRKEIKSCEAADVELISSTNVLPTQTNEFAFDAVVWLNLQL